MALKKTVTFKGIEVKDAYIKVWKFEGDKEQISFGVGFYKSATDELFDSQTHSCAYNIEADNPIKQAYEYLKTLEEFVGAQDC